MARSKSSNQLDLFGGFDPPPPPARAPRPEFRSTLTYRESLLEQIARDHLALREGDWSPGDDFYRERICAYTNEIKQLGEH